MSLRVSYLILKTSQPVNESASKLRGYIGSRFSEYPVLHHHVEGEYLYTYPRVQYRIVGGTPQILGIEEGAEAVKEVMDEIKELVLGGRRYEVTQRVLYEHEAKLAPSRRMRHYKFVTPWLALNPENYRRYMEARDWRERKELINRILVGNILSMCKSFGVVVTRRLHAHTHLETEKVRFKGINVIGFVGRFRVNFYIPEFFGLGKGVSQGFGMVLSSSE